MLIDVTINGKPAKVRVCDYCRALFVSKDLCSGRCAVLDMERRERMEKKTDVDKAEGIQ